ncbi:hypothetical protein FNM00_16620 [Aeromicrobium piscarium]|uniref:SipW-cognate class signal peptide n=2 Tax=Aeromicrobium piscarium TaxID=2590901 RepID=A0A554RNT4_9ACTN|nr:hypothetical protein FNM00_16620 [Aeromicrobium piscarium]
MMTAEQRPRRLAVLVWVSGVVLMLAVGVGGTMAFWSDEATVETGSLAAGRLDVTLNGELAGEGGVLVDTQFQIADLVPGESFARVIAVGNGGTVPLDYTMTGSTSGTLGAALRWTVVPGGSATNAGTVAGGNRAGSCTGGSSTYPSAAISGSATSPTGVIATPRPLAVGASEQVCVIVALDANAASTLQEATATARFVITGIQRGAP